jgi:hypothetical protein
MVAKSGKMEIKVIICDPRQCKEGKESSKAKEARQRN